MKAFKVLLISTIVLFSACSSSGEDKKSTDEQTAQANWDALGSIGQKMVCEIYNGYGDDKDQEMYAFMTSPTNEFQLTPGVANASIAILKKNC